MPRTRVHAYELAAHVNQAAFLVLENTCVIASEMCGAELRDADLAVCSKVLRALMDKGFIRAVADAARAVLSTSARLRSGITVRLAPGCVVHDSATLSTLFDGLMAPTISGTCEYVRLVLDVSYTQLTGAFQSASNQGASGSRPIPPELVEVFDALAESQLLAAAASALLDGAPMRSAPAISERYRDMLCMSMHGGASSLTQTLLFVFRLHMQLAVVGRLGQRLSAGLLRAARHEAVQRLQVGLLKQASNHCTTR